MSRFYGGLLVIVLGSIALLLVSIARGPERELTFARELPSSNSAQVLTPALTDPARWSEWFYSLERVQALDGKPIGKGSRIELFFNDKKSPWSHIELTAEVLALEPSRLQLSIVADSKKKLDHLFDHLEWDIQVLPRASGSHIKGTATAHTSHWRSRLVGTLVEKALMNQVFYPNLIKLAELKPTSAKTGHETGPEPFQFRMSP